MAPPKPPELPVEPREYQEFWRTPRMAWWRSVLALLMGFGGWLVVSVMILLPGIFIDIALGNASLEDYANMAELKITPTFFLLNNLALATGIAVAYLTQWACVGQRPRWLASIVGRFRWGWLGTCLALTALAYLPLFVVELWAAISSGELAWEPSTPLMLIAVLLTTPFQSAGEEFMLRGVTFRAVAAWLPRRAGLIVGMAVNAVIFASLHVSSQPLLNAFYVTFAVIASVLAWRTGGLEAAVALHVVNNLVGLSFAPFADISELFDRSSAPSVAAMGFQFATMGAAMALMLWFARRRQLVTSTAPAAVAPPSSAPVLAQDAGQVAPPSPWGQTSPPPGSNAGQQWHPGSGGRST